MPLTSESLAISRQFCCIDDISLIKRVVISLQSGLVVILGSGAGTMSLAVLETRPTLTIGLLTVDHKEESLAYERESWKAACKENPFNVVQSLKDSSQAGRDFPRSVDFLVIDSDHTEWGVEKDLRAWMKHIKTNGHIMLHDYTDIYPGTKISADRMLVEPMWKVITTEGWSRLYQKVR